LTEFQTVSMLLVAGLAIVAVSVWLSVVCGETKPMLEYLKSLGTLIFGAVLALIQAWRSRTTAQPPKPDESTVAQPPSTPQS